MLEREPSQRGHVIGRTCLEGWCDSILTFSFPSSACITSWGISKYLTINLQYFRDFPPWSLFPLADSCFTVPENLGSQDLTRLSSLCPLPPVPSLFCLLGLPHFPGPNCLLPQIFRFLGQVGPQPWVWWSEPWLAGSVCLALPAAFLSVESVFSLRRGGEVFSSLSPLYLKTSDSSLDLRECLWLGRLVFHVLKPV